MSSASANANVYGGDEINAVVLDAGSYHTRIGFAGDDFPKVITPSFYSEYENDGTEEEPTSEKILSRKSNITGRSKTGRIFGESINVVRNNYGIKSILKDSEIVEWDAAIDQYTEYFSNELKLNYKEQPILITEPFWTSTEYRKKLVETFYENFDFPALFLAKAPTCISFQQGRPNCLVVDIGHDTISVTPVIDGILLLKNSMRTHYAGNFLTDQFKDLITSKFSKTGINNDIGTFEIVPNFKIKSKELTKFPSEKPSFELKDFKDLKITKSFEDYQIDKIYHELKETLLEVPEKKLISNSISHNNAMKDQYRQENYKRLFEFPNGQSVEFSSERFQIADSIFEPQSYKFSNEALQKKYPNENGEVTFDTTAEEYKPLKRSRKAETTTSATSTPPPSSSSTAANGEPSNAKANGNKRKISTSAPIIVRGLSQLVTQVLSSVDIDLRASVAHNIIVTGSTSMIPQLTERLYTELLNMNPGLKIRLHATGNSTERFNQTWIGGSVLASLGTFHQMWVSKQEYEEAGSERILSQRFR